MSALLASWVAYPVLLTALGLGAGGVVQALAGRPLPLALRLPCGTALLMAVLDLAARTSATAPLAVPAAVAVGVAGLVLAPPRPRRPLDPAIVVGGGVFAVFAAPIVLSGQATWAGYIKLDDTATWLALVDRALEHGHSLAGLPTSTYADTLANYLATGYPLGSFLPLGLGGKLLGTDIAWLTNPWMAYMAALLGMALHRVARRALPGAPPWQPVLIAVLAAQPALLYAYYLWGGMKELAGAFLVATFAGCAPLVLDGERRLRAALPGVIVLWALIASLSPGGLVWIGPGAILAVALLARRRLRRPPVPWLGLGAVLAAGGAYLVLRPGGFVERYKGVLTGGHELGNLTAPLGLSRLAGVWPAGDFRSNPSALQATHVLIALVALAALAGIVIALRGLRRELILFVLCALAGALIVHGIASPWLGGKALATASPALPLAALVAAATLIARGHTTAGALLGALVGVAILWSNLYAAHDANLAPRQQYAELADIGTRIAGQGPTLMTEYSPWGARHFLRRADPESASELRTRVIPLLTGQPLPKGAAADLDQFQLPGILTYRTIVLQRSPAASRPPTPYRLVLSDRFWEVWQRPPTGGPAVLSHLPLGEALHPGAVASCPSVLALARSAGTVALSAAPAATPVAAAVGAGEHPASWSSSNTSFLTLNRAGAAQIPIMLPAAGRYALWLGGSIRGPLTLSVDNHSVGEARNQIQEAGQYVPLGALSLRAGEHTVTLRYAPSWQPGSGGPPDTVGPLVLAPVTDPAALMRVPPSQAHTLCGRNLDWIEALGA
jgi:hypothetical protein